MESSVKQRIKEFAKYKERSVRSFESKVGLTLGYVNAIRKSIQPDKIERIASTYPDLNISWLLTGEGDMTTSDHLHNKLIGEKLKIYFNEHKLNQTDIASQLGVSQAAVSALLRGKPFGSKTAKDWSEKFGFNINWLLTGDGPMLKKENHAEPPKITNSNQNQEEMSNEGMFSQLMKVIDNILAENAREGERIDHLLKQKDKADENIDRLISLLEEKKGVDEPPKKRNTSLTKRL